MSKTTTSFDHLWQTHLEPKAKDNGLIDGDMPTIRKNVKNMLVSAGWSDAEGNVDFVSANDLNNCLTVACDVIERSAPVIITARTVTISTPTAGFTPTKAQVLASAEHATLHANVELTSTQEAQTTFTPVMASIGDRCPRCSGSMEAVALVNDRAGLYCTRDRVVLPLPADHQVR